MGKPKAKKKGSKKSESRAEPVSDDTSSTTTQLTLPPNNSNILDPLGRHYVSKHDFSDWYDDYSAKNFDLPHLPMTRTAFMLLDHQQYKAAIVIQKYFRRWHEQLRYERMRYAALLIQAAWRRYRIDRMSFLQIERKLQQTLTDFYNEKATKIQAWWRGYWSRQTVHDHKALNAMQASVAKELLQCVAFKMHYLLRTRQIPGVYSLRNSHCLSQVEKLLASFSFKKFNSHACFLRQQQDCELERGRRIGESSTLETELPYRGPSECKGRGSADIDERTFRLLSMYQNALREGPKRRRSSVKPKSKEDECKQGKIPTPCLFCKDILDLMRSWKILDEKDITIDSNIFKQPGRLEKILDAFKDFYDSTEANCSCRHDVYNYLDNNKPANNGRRKSSA